MPDFSRHAGTGRIVDLPVSDLMPAPENDLYRPVREDDPEIIGLANSLIEFGIQNPLIVSEDGYILGGHRRRMAAEVAGMATVPALVAPVRRTDDPERFRKLLRENNRQRDKSRAEQMKEELLDVNPEEEYEAMLAHIEEKARPAGPVLDLGEVKTRKKISDGKRPMLEAAIAYINENRSYWPLSDRTVHYGILNNPPWRFVRKDGTGRNRYKNDEASYNDLCDLLTRARLAGDIPWEALADETRPVEQWRVFPDPRAFVRQELECMFKGYRRDLMRSQPNHIELLCEKNTARPVLERVAQPYTIPVVTGRGFCSIGPRAEMVERFKASGKARLVLLIASDFDPPGEAIAQSFGRSLRDDFGVEPLAYKIALNSRQVRELDLPPAGKVKRGKKSKDGSYASDIQEFLDLHGDNVWELEALPRETLAELTKQAIESVIEPASVNLERNNERKDAAFLGRLRRTIHAEARYAIEDEDEDEE
ncbi:ParB N-terminal domain-containing protein [Alienimonas sp. DA493]|uniref:ParB N-terminal domain-containing protein n=1 Tax=Alienimonas sp. DA493 TaxID=3373605 RepID=UPI0037550DA6